MATERRKYKIPKCTVSRQTTIRPHGITIWLPTHYYIKYRCTRRHDTTETHTHIKYQTARCYTTWRPCSDSTTADRLKRDAPAPRHYKQHGGRAPYCVCADRLKYSIPSSTTSNMATARNTILTLWQIKYRTTRLYDGTTRWPTHSNTRLHNATKVACTGLYSHVYRLASSLTKQVHPQPSQKQLSLIPNHLFLTTRMRTVHAEYLYTRYHNASNMYPPRP
jgi:hypothetical protein